MQRPCLNRGEIYCHIRSCVLKKVCHQVSKGLLDTFTGLQEIFLWGVNVRTVASGEIRKLVFLERKKNELKFKTMIV